MRYSLLTLRTGGFKSPSGKNKRLSDAKTFRFGGIVRLKDACTLGFRLLSVPAARGEFYILITEKRGTSCPTITAVILP